MTRREWLALSSAAAAATLASEHALAPRAWAQTPKRGGTLNLKLWDPPHFDPHLTISYKTHIPYTFTHSRLVKHRAGPAVVPGTFPIEGDLAESWSQTNETTFVFKLRKNVRWQNKPPVNGREFTADDVVYSVQRFRTVTGNANAYMLKSLDKVEAVDKHTVRFTLKEPYAWFLDVLANPMAVVMVAKECVEKFGDLKKPEATVGTGPWMFDSYRPNVGMTLVRNPNYFVPGLPYIDKVEIFVDEDKASRIAAFIAGKFDLGPEFPGTVDRTDWVQIKDALKQRRPGLVVREFPSNVMSHVYFRGDKAPFNDVRVRRAMSMALDRKGIVDAVLEGVGVPNPAVPAALKDWSIPFDQLGEGAQWFKYDPAAAKRLLAEAGHPRGFQANIEFATYGNPIVTDTCQLIQKYFKEVGIDVKLTTKEYGAYIASTFYGKYDSMAYGPQTPFLEPDNFLYGQYYPGETKNHGYVNDPVLADMLVRQRRTLDPNKRRDTIFDIQRHIARQQHYVQLWSSVYLAVWDPALQNYGPNLGYDYGGRLLATWLNR